MKPDNCTIKVTASPYLDGRIEIQTHLPNRFIREVIDTQEFVVRQALIGLGWTPPQSRSVLPDHLREDFHEWLHDCYGPVEAERLSAPENIIEQERVFLEELKPDFLKG